MMQAKEVEALITAMVAPLLQDTGLTLVDVEYVREKDWYLRIFLDKPGGVEIDDCQMVSEKLTEILERILFPTNTFWRFLLRALTVR